MVYQGTLGSPVRRSQRLAGRQTPVGVGVSTGGVNSLWIYLSIQGNSNKSVIHLIQRDKKDKKEQEPIKRCFETGDSNSNKVRSGFNTIKRFRIVGVYGKRESREQ